MLEIAQKYLASNFSIFPIKPKDKSPHARLLYETNYVKTSDPSIGSWKPLQTQKPTIEDILHWFLTDSESNIAVATGEVSNLTVIDIDNPTSNPLSPDSFPPTLTAKTGSGGYHLFYRYHPNIPNSASHFAPSIDTKNNGGYVILPPSTHPNGNKYEWIHRTTIQPFPIDHPLFKGSTGNKPKLSREDWDTLIQDGAPPKTRNISATYLIGKLLFHLSPHISIESIYSLVVGWNQRNNPPLPLRELDTTFYSIISKHYGNNIGETEENNQGA